jgi:TonB-linked SusC/RagA family outer membrane protein
MEIQKTLTLFLFLVCALSSNLYSQIRVNGKTSDSTSIPLPGVSILVKGTSQGTVSDFDGNYSILVAQDATLVFSYLGYTTKEIAVLGKNIIDVTLSENNSELDEVVVVGYGQQKKVNLTGAVATVTFKDQVNQPVTNSGQLMYGKFAGVQLTQSSGSPGNDGSSIVIRGIGTFGNSTPLVVIDNIQYSDLTAFNNLAPSDIESISVLKDASASAIYGARGANGVVLVTTKTGEKNKFEVNYNNYFGIQSATVLPEFLKAVDYSTLINEKFRNQDGPSYTPRYNETQLEAIRTGSMPDQFANTNWVSNVIHDAPINNHHLSLTGGNEKTTYRFSLGYLSQESIIKSKFRSNRYNISFNLNSQIKKWLKFNTTTNAFWTDREGPTGGQNALTGNNGIIYQFQRAAPTIPAYYSNGEYGVVDGAYENTNYSFQTNNPIRRAYLGNWESDKINVSQRFGLTFDLSDALTFETSGSANVIYSSLSDFSPTQSQNDWEGNPVIVSSINNLSNSTNFNYLLLNENILRFKKIIDENHNFEFLLGHSVTYAKNDGFLASIGGFPTDNLEEFNSGGVLDPSVSGGASEESYQSFFGRINYSYKGKYLAEFNIRRDGSVKFGPRMKYGNFPSTSIGWRISEENFFKNIYFINNLKFRFSWGISGNDRIGNYIYEQTYNPNLDYVLGNDTTVVGVGVTRLANPTIKWEETTQYDIGLDIGMFKNRLEIVVDYFKRDSDDILYGKFPIPSTIGITNLAAQNAASMVNEGLEFAFIHTGNIKSIKYSIGANFTKFLNNEVTGLGAGGEETIGNIDIIRIGEPFKAYYGYKAIGVFSDWDEVLNSPKQFGNTQTAPGDLRYADISGPDGIPDGIVDAEDRTIIGNPHPEFLFNFNGSIDFNNFDLNFNFQGVSGVDRLLMGNGNLPINDNRSNVLSYWIDRWTPENPSINLPRIGGQNNDEVSSFYIQDASYLRLKNIEIGYTISNEATEKIDISKLRIFVGAQNLITYTGLEHFDPERANGSQSNRSVPLYKTITMGINVKF